MTTSGNHEQTTPRNLRRVLFAGTVVLFLCVVALVLVVLDRSTGEDDEVVLARVGDRRITARDFLMNYEFGYPHLKSGKTPQERKRAYLNAMVNELLLAEQGYRLGLDNIKPLKDLRHRVTTDLLVDALIDAEVVAQTVVTDQEIREAINKSHALFRMRYWGEPDAGRALAVRQAMVARGYTAVVDSLAALHPDIPIDRKMLETEYVNAFDMDPALLAAVKDLQVGDISGPVPVRDGFYLFQVVDIRRQGVLEQEYEARAATVRKVLLNAKYDEGIARYVGSYMTGQVVVTKGKPFWLLTDAVLEWMGSGDFRTQLLRDAVLSAPSERTRYRALQEVAHLPIVEFKGGHFTVREFLDIFLPSIRDLDTTDMAKTRHQLSDQVALTVRNELLAAEARRRNLDTHEGFTHERQLWMNKGVYEEMRDRILHGHGARMADSAGWAVLRHVADSLRAVHKVEINAALLDTLTTTESAAGPGVGVQLFRLGNKRPAVPVTDPGWGRGN